MNQPPPRRLAPRGLLGSLLPPPRDGGVRSGQLRQAAAVSEQGQMVSEQGQAAAVLVDGAAAVVTGGSSSYESLAAAVEAPGAKLELCKRPFGERPRGGRPAWAHMGAWAH